MERNEVQQKNYNYIKSRIKKYNEDSFKNVQLDPLETASETAKRITTIYELRDIIDDYDLTKWFDDEFMRTEIKTKGNANGLITVELVLITDGATVPKSKVITLTIQHISDAEVSENIKFDKKQKAKEAEKQKLNEEHEKEMNSRGYERFGDTYEVWIKKENGKLTLLDEFKGYFNLSKVRLKRYGYIKTGSAGGSWIENYWSKADTIIMNNVTSIDTFSRNQITYSQNKTIEMHNLEELKTNAFYHMAIKKGIFPKLKKLSDDFSLGGQTTLFFGDRLSKLRISWHI